MLPAKVPPMLSVVFCLTPVSSIILFIVLLISPVKYDTILNGYYGDGVIIVYSLGILSSLLLLVMLLFNCLLLTFEFERLVVIF